MGTGYVGLLDVTDILMAVIGLPLLGALYEIMKQCLEENDWPWSSR